MKTQKEFEEMMRKYWERLEEHKKTVKKMKNFEIHNFDKEK